LTAARRIEVDEFDSSTAPRVIHRATRTPSTINRSRLIGLGGTLILHGLVVPMCIPTTLVHQKRPPDSAGTSVSRPVTAPADELVLLTIDSPKRSDSALGAPRIDLRSQLTKLAIPLAVPDQLPVIDLSIANVDTQSSAQAEENPGDAELRARMFGRYTGQIRARIERAWEKPTSPANDLSAGRTGDAVDLDTFVCQVQIRQDNRGNVQEVLLLACNGTEAWRHSLVIAINQASPLPAPPIPTVFQRALTMTFSAQASHAERFAGTHE
jgi:TonB C terminal